VHFPLLRSFVQPAAAKCPAIISSFCSSSSELGLTFGSSLFAYTKPSKDLSEYLIGGNCAGDGAEVVEGFAEILSKEVGG
jgi:hypothetical protein